MNQPLPPNDERIVPANSSPDAAIIGQSGGGSRSQPGASEAGASNNRVYPLNSFPSMESYYYGGYDNNTSGWSGYPQYASADGLQVVPPVIYGDNTALGLHPLYGFNSQMTYGQYSPVSTPVPSMVMDNQLYSPQQIPYSPSYYPQAVATSVPNISASVPVSQDPMNLKGNYSDSGSNVGFYNMPGMFGSGEPFSITSNPVDLSQRTVSPITSTGAYSHPIGTYASYDPNIAQTPQQRPMSGYGLTSDFFTGQYAYDAANQSSNFSYLPSPQPTFNYTNQIYLEKGRYSRQQAPTSVVPCDRNRGPRSLKGKGKDIPDNNAVSISNKVCESKSALKVDSLNSPDFPTAPENAKFFIIKSFSEDNIHRSIKYGVWASTVHGNKKLDDAYKEAKESGNCPVYLFFSVNASSQFCGVAEMVGPLDFEKNADYWQQDRWSGQFPVTWHILKDLPNSKFHHILLENNDNKPVTHSRDSQEVKLEQGIEMLKIFKEYEATSSILDDFDFYDERERMLQERKSRLVGKPKMNVVEPINTGIINEISGRLDQALQLEENTK